MMTRLCVLRMVVILLIALPLNFSFSQQNPLQLNGVNGWNIGFVSPPPYNIFDSLNTGMQILPLEGPSTDSVQLFQMYGNTRRLGNQWNINFRWRRDQLPSAQYEKPQYVLFDLRIRSYVNLAYLLSGITLDDTTNHIASFTWNTVELGPDWQTFSLFKGAPPFTEYVHQIGLIFYLYGPDSTYIGLEILLNNLRFVYVDTINGNVVEDTILVDPFQYTFPSSVVNELPEIPDGFILHQNYPNPFNPNTKIRYEIPEASDVKLIVYDLLGQQIVELVNEFQNTGIYEAEFDASRLASGTYIYLLRTERFSLKRKLILLK